VNEATIKVGETEEDLDVVNRRWDWPFGNCGDTIWLHGDAVGGNDETEEGRGGSVEFTFAEFTSQTILAEPG
jgi:hypothetical protein